MNKCLPFLLVFVLLLSNSRAHAQWEAGIGLGKGFPFSGYKTVVKDGVYRSLIGGRYLKNKDWSLAFSIDWAKLHKDRAKSDAFIHPKLDLVSFSAGVRYILPGYTSFQPYAGAAMGVTLYNFKHEPASNTSTTITNASFSIVPYIGVQYITPSNITPFVQVNTQLVMDGPPKGFSKADKLTGYSGLLMGLRYTFR